MKFFVYQTRTHIQIEKAPNKKLGELIITFHDLEVCRKWVKKNYPKTRISDFISIRPRPYRFSPSHLRQLSLAKRGKLNPRWGKPWTAAEKAKCSKTMTGTREGMNNPNFGRRHSALTRLKMSLGQAKAHRRRKRKLRSLEIQAEKQQRLLRKQQRMAIQAEKQQRKLRRQLLAPVAEERPGHFDEIVLVKRPLGLVENPDR